MLNLIKGIINCRTAILAFLLLAAVNTFSQTNNDKSAELIITIKGIQVEQGGKLILNLYQGEENWLESGKQVQSLEFPIANKNELQAVFNDLPYQQGMAIQVIHDSNSNGKMDFQWFPPKPKEGVAVSNNHFRVGPPLYEKAKIFINKSPMPIEIRLRY